MRLPRLYVDLVDGDRHDLWPQAARIAVVIVIIAPFRFDSHGSPRLIVASLANVYVLRRQRRLLRAVQIISQQGGLLPAQK